MNCPQCGAELKSAGKFCLQCGENISYVKKKEYDVPTPPVSATPHEQKSSPDNTKTPAHNDVSERLKEQLSAITQAAQVTDEIFMGKIRSRLTAWADSIPHHGIKNFGDVLELGAVQQLDCYHVLLYTTVEKRESFQEKKKPYDGEPVPQTVLLRQNIESIWSFQGKPPDELGEGKVENLIPESFKKQRCLDCMGQPKHLCESCRGKKTIPCPHCNGSKQKRCERCKGSGKIRCWSCNGQGRRQSADSGSKQTTCIDCQGQGALNCSDCQGGFVECNQCDESGFVVCERCKGAGTSVCMTCEGKGEVLNYLSFESNFSSSSVERFIPHTELSAAFPLKKLKEQKPTSQVIDLTVEQVPGLRESSDPISNTINELITLSNDPVRKDKNQHICRQRLRIQAYTVWKITYTFDKKEYVLYMYGVSLNLYEENNPIKELEGNWLQNALDALNKNDWKTAQHHIENILRMNSSNARCQDLLRHIRQKIRRSMVIWGFLGGLLAGCIAVSFIVYARSTSLNYIWPVVWAGLASLCLGSSVGLSFGFIAGLKRMVPKISWKIPFFASLSTVLTFFAVLIFVFHYDPIRIKDKEQYLNEFQQALPYGIPSVPWDDDIRFLRKLIKKFKPTGIGISKAEKGLKKLKMLKKKKIEKAQAQKKKKIRINARARNRAQSARYKKLNQAAFDKDMENYENLSIQKKLITKKQKIYHISRIIRKYKKKGINITKAYQELKRLKKK